MKRESKVRNYEAILIDDGSKHISELQNKFKEISQCPHCKTQFSMKKNLLKHVQIIHKIFDSDVIKPEQQKAKIGHRCSECGKVFSLRKNLFQHLRKIHGKTEVGRKSSSKENIKLICDICGLSFGGKKSLMRHLRMKHNVTYECEKKTVATCSYCDSTFSHNKSLYKHERKFHGGSYKKISKENDSGNVRKRTNLCSNPGIIDDYVSLKEVLPERYEYELTHFTWLKHENGPNIPQNWFKAKLFFFCRNREDIEIWRDTYERQNRLSLRVLSFPRPRTSGVLYKGRFRCHHNTMPKKGTKPNAKHTACSAILSITLLQSQTQMQSKECNFDENSKIRLKALIFIKHTHNHMLGDAASLKYRKPMCEVKKKFIKLFEEKKTVPQALAIHKANLEADYGAERFASIVNDRAFMPDARWAYGLYYNFLKENPNSLSENVAESNLRSTTEFSVAERSAKPVPSLQYRDSQNIWIDSLKDVFREIIERCESSSYFHSAAQSFVNAYKISCKTDSQLSNALQFFGKCDTATSACEIRPMQPERANITSTTRVNQTLTINSSKITSSLVFDTSNVDSSISKCSNIAANGSKSDDMMREKSNLAASPIATPTVSVFASNVTDITITQPRLGIFDYRHSEPVHTPETSKYLYNEVVSAYPIENYHDRGVATNSWTNYDYLKL